MKTLHIVSPRTLFKSLLILLPAIALTACTPFVPYAGPAAPGYYVVQPGENLHSIAFALETTPQALLAANPWANSAELSPGTRLVLPTDARGPGIEATPAAGGEARAVAGAYIWPLPRYELSSRYGRRWGRFHRGIDLSAPRGTAIRAIADGRVSFSGRDGAFGNKVVVDHGKGIKTVYAHNLRNLVGSGQWVEQGEVIATVGRTGNATGYHLHFEFRRNGRALNPLTQIRAAPK